MRGWATSLVAILGMLAGVGMSGCANYLHPFELERAKPGVLSPAHDALRQLPPPKEKVIVAVYRFRDQTGQYKASDRVASWSTAVTQGATSILIRALEESDWFVPIEREGLSNLLNERQIIQSIRAQHLGPDGEPLGPLPPLLYAGVLLEGGIIGYDTNLLTGGAGARYFGVGASGQFRRDQVTVYLRAVSTQTGRVLKTVYTTKTILSQKVDATLFRFVEARRLLEAEVGYSFNEPLVLAVTEAIEESVKNLIIEGVREGVWALADPEDADAAVFQAYDAAQQAATQEDYFGHLLAPYRSGVGVGASLGGQRLEGDYVDPLARPMSEAHVRFALNPRLSLGIAVSAGEIAASGFSRTHLAADAFGLYYLLPNHRVSPFLTGGAGVLLLRSVPEGEDDVFPYVMGGVGVEVMLSRRFGLGLTLSNLYPLSEGLDGVKLGRVHDNVWRLKSGLTYYLN